MHRLQQHILHQLMLSPTCRYADLKPAEVEGNLFMYHLRCQMKEGNVEKTADGRYRFTAAGKTYMDRLSLTNWSPRIQPRIVTLTAMQDDSGRWLMYRRKRQPLLNYIGFPYGKIHLGETVAAAANRELTEKTGLTAQLQHIGDGYANTFENDQPISQIMFHFFYGTARSGGLIASSEVGDSLWLTEAELRSRLDTMPNVLDLLELVKSYHGQRFFAELNHNLK